MKRIVVGLVAASMMAGCVSVDSTRAQLASSDAQEVRKAEETIYKIGSSRQYLTQERISYIKLTRNQELLMRIFDRTCYDREVGAAVARQMDFSKENSIVDFIKKYEKELSSFRIDKQVTDALIDAMLATAGVDELVNAARYLGKHHALFFDLRDPLALKLVEVVTDQETLFELVDRERYPSAICLENRTTFRKALDKLTDQKNLMSVYCDHNCYDRGKVLEKITDETICEFIQNDSRFKNVSGAYCNNMDPAVALVVRIKDENVLARILVGMTDDSGAERLFYSIDDENALARVAVDAKNGNIRKMAAEKLKSYAVISSVLKNEKVADEKLQLVLVRKIEAGSADQALYDAIKNPTVKKAVLAKLSKEGLVAIRSRDNGNCEKLLEKAKGKGGETFELAGFYLGMPIEDAEKLVIYHFPDFLTQEGKDGDDVRILDVSFQAAPFCYADKDGRVYQFNFGKKMLKKWYPYDVQSPLDWAQAYSKENNVDMRYKQINKETTLVIDDLQYGSSSSLVTLCQDSYQYKHNTKGYRLIYYGEAKTFTPAECLDDFAGNVIKARAAEKFKYVRGDEGALRVQYDGD